MGTTSNPPLQPGSVVAPPAPLTPAQIAVIQQKFDLASATKAFPGLFTEVSSALVPPPSEAVFLFTSEPDGSTIFANGNISATVRQARCQSLVAKGYAPLMLFGLCWEGYDHFQWYKEMEDAGVGYYPPRFIESATGLILQPNLGQPGQYALPGAYHPGMGLLGPYPTTKPEGWISIPDVNSLLVPGADVDALLAKMF
jgi:hypothetical protein